MQCPLIPRLGSQVLSTSLVWYPTWCFRRSPVILHNMRQTGLDTVPVVLASHMSCSGLEHQSLRRWHWSQALLSTTGAATAPPAVLTPAAASVVWMNSFGPFLVFLRARGRPGEHHKTRAKSGSASGTVGAPAMSRKMHPLSMDWSEARLFEVRAL